MVRASVRPAGEESQARAGARGSPAPSHDHCDRKAQVAPAADTTTYSDDTSKGNVQPTGPADATAASPLCALPDRVPAPHARAFILPPR